jgi:uncharacterized OsmC-like protein
MTDAITNQKNKTKIQEIKSKTEVEWLESMQFKATYDLPDVQELIMDEPPQFGGEGQGPNASRVLASAIGNCLAAALIYCLKKARIPVETLKSTVDTKIARNSQNQLRVQNVEVELQLQLKDPSQAAKSERCQQLFENYCIVTDSVRKGIPVNVNVKVL